MSNVVVTFSAPTNGASGTFGDTGTNTTTAVTNASGIATAATLTANSVRGAYQVTATVSGIITSANFLLSNIAWYVASIGNDSLDCQMPATACATINSALAKDGFLAGDTVFVANGMYTNTTGSEVVLIDKDIILVGGWDVAFTTQNGMSTIDGEGGRRGITVNSDVTVTIIRFFIQNGSVVSSGGGGIATSGTLTLNNSVVSDNTSGWGGGGIWNVRGTVTLNNSTVSANTSSYGGGIYNSEGTMTLNNSTVSNNTSQDGIGGGIANVGTLTLNNSTVSSNTSQNSNFGGIYNGYGTVTLQNSLLAGNTDAGLGPDCTGDIVSSGYNLIGNTTGCTFTANTGDLLNFNPQLFPLIVSLGVHPLLPWSPAINAGNPAGCTDNLGNPLNTDQRGVARVGRCDIGAYEYDPNYDPLTYMFLPLIVK